MLIAGVVISNKANLLVIDRELQLFIKTYVEANIEGVDPQKLDANFIACDLQKNLEHAFNRRFSVSSLDGQTWEPLDDLSIVAMLEVDTPLELPSLRVH
jgi:hypothetical protein